MLRTRRIEHDTSVVLRLNLVTMEIRGIENETFVVILTFGASGHMNSLLFVQTFRRLVLSIHDFLLWIFMSF
jgi:hypothetical protein